MPWKGTKSKMPKRKQSKKTKKKKQSGGRVHMPGAYFGTPNDVYQCSPSAGLENHAYGAVNAVSYGVSNADGTNGPSLHVFPNSSGQMTGGCGCSGGVSALGQVPMAGGANENPYSCVQSQPTQKAGSCGLFGTKGRGKNKSLKGGGGCGTHSQPTQRGAGGCDMAKGKGRNRSLKGGGGCGTHSQPTQRGAGGCDMAKGKGKGRNRSLKGGGGCGTHSQPTQRGGSSCSSYSRPTQRAGKK